MENFQIGFVIFLMFFSSRPFADTETLCCPNDWSCHGSFFLTAGGVFSHVYFKHNDLTFSPPGQPSISYSPELNYPNNFPGFRIGFGDGFNKKLPFAYEFDYSETFHKAKTSPDIKIGISTKSFVGFLSYALNPESRLKVSAVGGLVVFSTYLTAETAEPSPFYFNTTNSVDVEPFLGGSLIYQINSKFAFRFVEFYDIAHYNPNLRGRLVSLFMLNYYPI